MHLDTILHVYKYIFVLYFFSLFVSSVYYKSNKNIAMKCANVEHLHYL